MKKFIVIDLLIIAGFLLQNPDKAYALSQQVINQDITIEINKDSTFTVTETANYIFDGEFHGLRRDITLNDSASLAICENQNLTCGGFDHIEVLNVTQSNGSSIPERDLNFYNTSRNGNDYFRIEWEIYADGKEVSNYQVGWTIKYKVFGGIQEVGGNPYFYWDLLPEDRGSSTQSSTINIEFPQGVFVNRDNIEIYTSLLYSTTLTRADSNVLKINLKNFTSYGAITLAYPFELGEVELPGSLEYSILNPPLGADLILDGYKVKSSSTNGIIRGITPGEHTLEITRTGFNTITEKFEISANQKIVKEYSLQQSFLLSFIDAGNKLAFVLGILLIPITFVFAYLHYRRRGKDKKMPKTIIPEFAPPADVRPYLLGSIKDESVDKEDIAGSIIDLAYRGYLKIKEKPLEKVLGINVSKQEYELIRTDKSEDDLDKIEKSILNAIFDGKDSTTTKDMVKTFPYKYSSITSSIYSDMVDRGYFKESPRTTIGKYIGMGLFFLTGGILGLVFFSWWLTELLGYFTVFTFGLPLGSLGFLWLILAKFMPSKTESGSQVYAKILGFKMYLHTAERFRLQKLGPDEFEKYLSYAIVFGIEDEWAKKFEGLYDKVPDWYEGSVVNAIYNAYFFSTFARSFTTTTASSFSFPSQSASGSGWSGGGGSFGGFSGGGGGGGSSGGW